MSVAGPSRSVATALVSARPARRWMSSSLQRSEPLAAANICADPSAALSVSIPSVHQKAKDRISQMDVLRPAAPSPFLRDRHKRQHTYLRMSLTEKCNLRCLYCMPEDGVPLTPSDRLLSSDEVIRLASLFVSQGITKIRLTGGEPTIRPDLPHIIQALSQLRPQGLQQIGITTNGIALGRKKLDTLVANGLTHLNISLDTLDPFKFEFITRRRGHDAVMKCIERALELGVQSVKINVVVIKGLNDTTDALDFVRFTKDKRITVRFIEVSLPIASIPSPICLTLGLDSICLLTETSGRCKS